MDNHIKFNLHTPREVPDFPTEVTFKAVYRNMPFLADTLAHIFAENNISPLVSSKTSRGGKFISFTVTAHFESEDQLRRVCASAASMEGFTTMF
jgi:putative lipoic acid-binding regulatory protein